MVSELLSCMVFPLQAPVTPWHVLVLFLHACMFLAPNLSLGLAALRLYLAVDVRHLHYAAGYTHGLISFSSA